MGAFLRSVLNHQSDVHYDEANPQFRFIFGSTHCLVSVFDLKLSH
jgi:hypothetical protein